MCCSRPSPGRGPYLLPGLVRGRHHHRVADGQRQEEVDDVCEVGGQLGHGLAVEVDEVQLAAALVHLVQELGIRRDVLLLWGGGRRETR